LPVHLKVDTGMGRLGILPDGLRPLSATGPEPASAVAEVKAMARLPGVVLEGIYTHFAAADSADKASARNQFKRFMDFVESLRAEGIDFALRHAANSAAIIDLPETHLDLVRAGIALYGLRPSDRVDLGRVSLKPAMTLKARIVHTKRVPAGFTVSYGSTFKTKSASVIATVPIGYADGYRRRLSNRGQMTVRGCRAPIAGRVCMDQTMLDVSHIPEVTAGDEVVVFGPPGDGVVTADDLATELKTINYEIVSTIMARVPRIYRDSGDP
jgi:alanine racemase